MGLFSGKTKHYTSVTNSPLYDKSTRPNTIKDVTAGYIKDAADGLTGDNYNSDYMRLAIPQSIVRGVKRADRYLDKRDTDSILTNEAIISKIDLNEEEIREAIDIAAKRHYPYAEINYLNYEHTDFTHIVRMILQDEHSWETTSNMLNIDGYDAWLENVSIRVNEEHDDVINGYSFNSGVTATREEDLTRPLNIAYLTPRPEHLNTRLPIRVPQEFIISYIPYYKAVDTVVSKVFYDSTTDEELRREEVSNTTETTKPEGENDTVYNEESVTEELDSYENPDNPDELIKEIKVVTTKESYGDTKYKTYNFADYMGITPNEVETINGKSDSPIDSNTANWIKKLREGRGTYTNYDMYEDIVILLSLVLNNGSRLYFFINSKDVDDEGIKGEIIRELNKSALNRQIEGLLPSIPLKHGSRVVDDTSPNWRLYKIYAKRLDVKLNGFYGTIRGENGEDEDKIRHAYVKYGVNFYANDFPSINYLFNFFLHYYTKNRESSSIRIKNKLYEEKCGWGAIRYGIADKSIAEDYARDGAVFYKKINDSQCEYVSVQGYFRNCNVVDGRWGSKSDDSSLLVPLDINLIEESLSIFKYKEELIYRATYVEFLTYVKVKQKWYQTSIFKAIIIVVGAAISFSLGGGDGGFFYHLAVSVATTFAIDAAIKLTIKILGPKWGKIIAIALAIASMGKGIQASMAAMGAGLTKVLSAFVMNAKLLAEISTKFLNTSYQTIGIERQEEMEEKSRELKRLEDMKETLLGARVDENRFSGKTNYVSNYIHFGSIEALIDEMLDLNKIESCIQYVYNCTEYMISIPTLEESVEGILAN